VEEPLIFLNIEVNEANISFEEAGNSGEYDEMLTNANEHPEYMERFFDKKMEEECEKADREREAKKKEVAEKLESIAGTIQLQNMNAVESEEQPRRNHPRKQPKPYPRGTYSAMPDPPVPITE